MMPLAQSAACWRVRSSSVLSMLLVLLLLSAADGASASTWLPSHGVPDDGLGLTPRIYVNYSAAGGSGCVYALPSVLHSAGIVSRYSRRRIGSGDLVVRAHRRATAALPC